MVLSRIPRTVKEGTSPYIYEGKKFNFLKEIFISAFPKFVVMMNGIKS